MENQSRLVVKRKLLNRKTTKTEAEPLYQNNQRFSYKRTVDSSKGRETAKFSKCIFSDKTSIFRNSQSKQINGYINHELSKDKCKKGKQFQRKMKRFDLFASKFADYRNTVTSQKNIKNSNEKSIKKPIPSELYNEIKYTFKYLQLLKNYGFSEKKIVKWMNSFLSKRGQLICDIFMRSYQNKKSLQNSIVYERLTNLNSIIQKMQEQVSRLSPTQILFLINEIKHFKSYVEEIVIKKSESNLKEMFCDDIINPMYKLCEDIQYNANIETMHFIKDLKSVQDRYGEMETVSKFNRFMFKEILQTEQKMLQQFYNARKQEQ